MRGVSVLSDRLYSNPFAVLLSGGVGGARMARGLAAVLEPEALTVIVNVGDDDRIYGVHVAADLDTVVYTLAGVAGHHGWGISDDTFAVMDGLDRLGVDTTFRLGDRDLANCLLRTARLDEGMALSACVAELCRALGVAQRVLPSTDDPVRTVVETPQGRLSFQEYFVRRRHRDEVEALEFAGADAATPAPGTIEAIERAELVVIAPSNPPLSIWPILAVPGYRDALAGRDRVVAVSPLFGGKPLRGPADRVMAALGLPSGNAGILAAYDGLLTDVVVDASDRPELDGESTSVRVHAANTRIADPEDGRRFAAWLIEELT